MQQTNDRVATIELADLPGAQAQQEARDFGRPESKLAADAGAEDPGPGAADQANDQPDNAGAAKVDARDYDGGDDDAGKEPGPDQVAEDDGEQTDVQEPRQGAGGAEGQLPEEPGIHDSVATLPRPIDAGAGADATVQQDGPATTVPFDAPKEDS